MQQKATMRQLRGIASPLCSRGDGGKHDRKQEDVGDQGSDSANALNDMPLAVLPRLAVVRRTLGDTAII